VIYNFPIVNIDQQIAERLKSFRSQQGWTLDRLATASGVSRGMISKIERGQASATAALLSRICVALGVPLSELVAPSERAGVLTRKAQRARWQDPATGFLREIVSPRPGDSAVEVIEVELPPNASVDYTLDSPAGYSQHIIVLTGSLRVSQAGEIDLDPGDALFMTPAGRIRFQNTTPRPCHYLVVVDYSRRS